MSNLRTDNQMTLCHKIWHANWKCITDICWRFGICSFSFFFFHLLDEVLNHYESRDTVTLQKQWLENSCKKDKTMLAFQRFGWGRFLPKQVRKARSQVSTHICLRDLPEIRLPLGGCRNPPLLSQETLNAVSHAGQKRLCQGREKVELWVSKSNLRVPAAN